MVESVRENNGHNIQLGYAEELESGKTHREGFMDAEGCPSMHYHVTLQLGTEVKLGAAGEEDRG